MARSRDEDEDFTDKPPRRRPRDDDEDEDDRPRRGSRRDEEEEEDEEDRPRRRRRDDDEDDEDRPRRRKRRRRAEELTGLDAMYANTNIVVLILFGCLCGGIAFILSLVAFVTCKDETAKNNAMITMIVSGILTVLGIGAQVASMLAR